VGYREGATGNDDAPTKMGSCLFRCFNINHPGRLITA
jgi:hypothetical protein